MCNDLSRRAVTRVRDLRLVPFGTVFFILLDAANAHRYFSYSPQTSLATNFAQPPTTPAAGINATRAIKYARSGAGRYRGYATTSNLFCGH